MCGLFGEIGSGTLGPGDTFSEVSRSLRHRGPDDEGLMQGDGWVLGFRRLAILDLSPAGHQPMRSEDGRAVIAFNGEIYNYIELRAELEARGERFRSGSDTEVLLRLLQREGAGALGRLNGMYAFVFIDLQTRRFIMARDRLGVKPLYLAAQGRSLRFASEIKALLAWKDAGRNLSRAALMEYLALGYLSNDTCIFEGYEKLAPGHYLEGSLDNPTVEATRYWRVPMAPAEPPAGNDEAVLARVEALLADATRLRMRSDVPVALLLSGGIDSGLVASLSAEGGHAPQALVAGIAGSPMDETDLARATAAHLGLDLHELSLDPSNLSDVDDLVKTFDEPFADTSALPMLKICEAARRHAIVLLTGDGGDEAFGGYRRYVEVRRYLSVMAVPDPLRALAWAIGRRLIPPRQAYRLAKATLPRDLLPAVFDGLGLARDPAVAAILPADLAAEAADVARPVEEVWQASAGLDLLSRQRLFDYGLYLPDDVLVKVDRASMAHSTEVRSPFLDYRVVELAATLPERLLVSGGQGKVLLRRLAARRLPAEVAAGSKKGFGVPVGDWMRTKAGAALLRERLLDGAAARRDLWRPQGVETVIAQHMAGKRDQGDVLWRLLVLDAWASRYLTESTS